MEPTCARTRRWCATSINTARPLIFSTAPPPPALAAALAALELLQESPHRVERLRSNALLLRRELAAEGFSVAEEGMHIVPLIVGEERMTMRLCQEAIERGVFAQAIRPPTVAAGTSRMRLAVMASHTASELRTAARVLGEAAHAVGLDPAEIGTPLREREVADVAPSVPVLETPSADPEPFSLGVEREAPETGPNPGRARLAAAARSRSEGPFDLEQLQAAGDAAPAGGAHEPDAPFDIERETAVQRAA